MVKIRDAAVISAVIFAALLQMSIALKSHAYLTGQKAPAGAWPPNWPKLEDPDTQPTERQKLYLETLKRRPLDVKVVNESLSLGSPPVWYVIQEGGYDSAFWALHEFGNDSTVQMSAWAFLSDHAHTEVGSDHIANYGGPNRGIEYMVQQMQAHPKPYDAARTDFSLTYRYEAMQCINGLLRFDANSTRGPAAVKAGLLEQVADSMRAEPDLISTQDVACSLLVNLLKWNPSYAKRLPELGIVDLINQAKRTHKEPDRRVFIYGTTVGDFYNVTRDCNRALGWFEPPPLPAGRKPHIMHVLVPADV